MARNTRITCNSDLVADLMRHSPCGPLGEVFIVEAIRRYANQCAKAGPAALDSPMLNGATWHRIAVDVKTRCDAFYNRNERN
jgi:hypothetical protein